MKNKYARPAKGWRVYVEKERGFYVWGGADWTAMPDLDMAFMLSRLCRGYSWTLPDVYALTISELRQMYETLPDVELYEARYTAVAFHDPNKLNVEKEPELDERALWQKAMGRLVG